MKVQVLDYINDDRGGVVVGRVDIKVIYDAEKFEIFRNLGHFIKAEREWLSFPVCKRNEQWVATYERNEASSKSILALALSELKTYFLSLEPSAGDPEPDNASNMF